MEPPLLRPGATPVTGDHAPCGSCGQPRLTVTFNGVVCNEASWISQQLVGDGHTESDDDPPEEEPALVPERIVPVGSSDSTRGPAPLSSCTSIRNAPLAQLSQCPGGSSPHSRGPDSPLTVHRSIGRGWSLGGEGPSSECLHRTDRAGWLWPPARADRVGQRAATRQEVRSVVERRIGVGHRGEANWPHGPRRDDRRTRHRRSLWQ